MISADDFLQTCNVTLMLSRHVSTAILMQECDSKYMEICFNRAFCKGGTGCYRYTQGM